ncbi:unnamed protein product, partial [Polarella glacialis]
AALPGWCLLLNLAIGCASAASIEGDNTSSTSALTGAEFGHDDWSKLFAQPPDVVFDLARNVTQGDSQPRKLADSLVGTGEGWDFPTGTKLGFGTAMEDTVYGNGAPASLRITVLAGYKYSDFSITLPTGFIVGPEHVQAAVKLAFSAVTRAACVRADYNVPMAATQNSADKYVLVPSPFASGKLELARTIKPFLLGDDFRLPYLVFMHGGSFKLCYTPDGSFEVNEYKNNVVPVLITVVGVLSDCLTDGCLAKERWDCYFTYRAEVVASCRVDFRTYGGGRLGWRVNAGGTSRVSWSKRWDADTYVFGAFTPGNARQCSDEITGSFIEPETKAFLPFSWIPPQGAGLNGNEQTAVQMPSLRREVSTDSFSMTACYCPNFDSSVDATPDACDHASEFIQPIGVIYYWMLRICDVDTYQSCGVSSPPFMRVMPQHPFVLRLQCPHHRLKIVFLPIPPPGPLEVPERAVWEPQARCKAESQETGDITWDPAPENGTRSYKIGGDRRDYKVWRAPNLLAMLPMEGLVEVCYCDSQCDDPLNYIKVGLIPALRSAGVARWTQPLPATGAIRPIETLKYVTKSGALTLYAGVTSNVSEGLHPYDSIPWRRKSLLKLVAFDNHRVWTPYGGSEEDAKVTLEKSLRLDYHNSLPGRRGLDSACAKTPYNAQQVNGPGTAEQAKEYAAWVGPSEPSKFLPFSGMENDQSFSMLKAGTYVICYCSIINDQDVCADDSYYIQAGKVLTIGPAGGVDLSLPTQFTVRVDLEGWGFSDTDSLRFISMTQTCMENANNPNAVLGGYRLGCPGINSTDCRPPTIKEDIPVLVISSDRTGIFIKSIEIGEFNSTLYFDKDIISVLLDGDAITIEESTILVNGKGLSEWTATERHIASTLSGYYGYADDFDARRMLWNRINFLATPAGNFYSDRLSIPVGWPDDDDRPRLTFVNAKGNWARRNRLQTNEDIKVDNPLTLKMCWGANDLGRQQYYGEAGVLNFVNPSQMSDAGIYLTSLQQGSVGPAIISLSPRRGRSAYKDYDIPIVLRILFKDQGSGQTVILV